MYAGNPESEKLLQQLRLLNAKMHPVEPDPIQLRKFRDLFTELDKLLKSGAMLPPSWITRQNFTTLPTEVTHTITDFSAGPPSPLLWCGHRPYFDTEYCNHSNCANYVNKHPQTKRS